MRPFESPGKAAAIFCLLACITFTITVVLNYEVRSSRTQDSKLLGLSGRDIAWALQQWDHTEEPLDIRRKRNNKPAPTEPTVVKEKIHPKRHHGKHGQEHHSSTPSTTTMASTTTTSAPEIIQEVCYTNYEVLLIIGLTCALNLTFVFMLMCVINYVRAEELSYTTTTSVPLPRLDSLDVPEEYLATGQLVTRSASCNGVQEYINNLPPPRSSSMSSASPQMHTSYSMEDLLYGD